MDELVNQVKEYSFKNGYVSVTYSGSEKLKKIVLTCDMFGKYRDTHNIPLSKRVRNTTTLKSGCICKAIGQLKVFGNKEYWVITHFYHNPEHKYEENLIAYLYARKKPKAVESFIRVLASVYIQPSKIYLAVKSKFPSQYILVSDINNEISKMKKDIITNKSVAATLLEKLIEEKYYVSIKVTKTNIITHLYFSHFESINIFNHYNSVIILDSTYKTNKYNMPLLNILGIGLTGKTFTIRYVLLQSEKQIDYTWSLKQLLNHIKAPKVIIYDCDLALINAINIVFPSSALILCSWHINNCVKSKCWQYFNKINIDGKEEEWDNFFSKWKSLISKTTKYDFNIAYDKFISEFSEKYSEAISYI